MQQNNRMIKIQSIKKRISGTSADEGATTALSGLGGSLGSGQYEQPESKEH